VNDGEFRGKDEDGSNLYVCKGCWELLKNPTTGLSLIRGNLTILLKNEMSKENLDKSINSFIESISKWKIKD
jgi:hypothetical protein